MPHCFVVGGLGESTINRDDIGFGVVWPEPTVLLLGKLGELRLAPNGVDPGEPDGVACVARGGAPGPYVAFPAAQLAIQLIPRGWTVDVYGWDWRKSIYPAGVELARIIRERISSDDPCAIVGHSAGGLVARAAWTDLGTTGQQALIRRIVTLGTPHWGSYSLVSFFQGRNRSIEICTYWNADVGANTAGWAPALTGYRRLTNLDYRVLGMTWPGLYDCLPVLGAPDAAADPLRPLLYNASSWPAEARPSQAHLDFARDHTGPWLRSAASQPPSDVLTCVSGRGYYSANRIEDAAAFLAGAGLVGDGEGDGTVTQAASELSTATVHRYICDHPSWFPSLVADGEVVALLIEVNPGPTPPPPEESPVIVQPRTATIPGAVLPDFSGQAVPPCGGAACTC